MRGGLVGGMSGGLVLSLLVLWGSAFVLMVRAAPFPACGSSQTFDVFSFNCVDCPSGAAQAPNGISCQCNAGFAASRDSETTQLTCTACASNEVVSLDGTACLVCDSAETTIQDGECRCNNPRAIPVEQHPNGTYNGQIQCVECAPSRQPLQATSAALSTTTSSRGSSSGVSSAALLTGLSLEGNTVVAPAQCRACPDPSMRPDGTQSCTCPAGETDIAGACWDTGVLDTYQLRFSDTNVEFVDSQQVIESSFFSQQLQPNWVLCRQSGYANTTACQVVANLCVLQMYEREDGACNIYLDLVADTPVSQHGWAAWPTQLPWLFHDEGPEALRRFSIQTSQLPGQRLRFFVIVTDAFGNTSPLTELGTMLQLCGDTTTAWQYLGTSTTPSRCSFTLAAMRDRLSSLQPTGNTAFLEVYVQMPDNSTLQPVPVLVRSATPGQVLAGNRRHQFASSSQYFRRFFLLDELSGRSGGAAPVVRYAADVSLRVDIPADADTLHLPLLIVSYKDLPAEVFANTRQPYVFRVRYHQSSRAFNLTLMGLTIAYVTVAFVLAGMHASSFARRNLIQIIDGRVLQAFFGGYIRALSSLFFWTTVGSCMYWLIFYQGQEDFRTVFPTDADDDWLPGLLGTACLLKLVEGVLVLRGLSSLDVFLVDWEAPSRSLPGADEEQNVTTTTIWRRTLIANEWNELALLRKIAPTRTLLLVLVILLGFGLAKYDEEDPGTAPMFNGGTHYTLRAALAFSAFCLAGLAQLLFFIIFYDRFVYNPLLSFVDLCSLANMSLLVFDSAVHGFYIHGRTPHGFADVDMYTMLVNLKKETDDVVARRGLETGDDLQTFEIFVPEKLRGEWDAMLDRISDNTEVLQRTSLRPGDVERMRQLAQANSALNQLFMGFLDHSFRDIDYVVKTRSFFERFLGTTPEIKRGIFYKDTALSIASTILLGHEIELLIVECAVFIFWDFVIQNYVAAALLTWVVLRALYWWFSLANTRNLAAKTITDGRFLI